MYLSSSNFDYVCFVIILVFYKFQKYFSHFTINKKSDSKMYKG